MAEVAEWSLWNKGLGHLARLGSARGRSLQWWLETGGLGRFGGRGGGFGREGGEIAETPLNTGSNRCTEGV